MAKVDQAAEEEGADDDRRQKMQRLDILLREDIVEHMLNQKRQHAISGAECQHTQNGCRETGKQIGAEKGKEAAVHVHGGRSAFSFQLSAVGLGISG